MLGQMEEWQFLIQRQGENNWAPIERENLVLQEDKYRLVIQSFRPNLEIEISIAHQNTISEQLIRCLQKRTRRTNPEGLAVVIPYTYLKPGLWELSCSYCSVTPSMEGEKKSSLTIEVVEKTVALEIKTPQFTSVFPQEKFAPIDWLLPLFTPIAPQIPLALTPKVYSIFDLTSPSRGELLFTQPFKEKEEKNSDRKINLFTPKQESSENQPIPSDSGFVLPPKIERSSPEPKKIPTPQLPKIDRHEAVNGTMKNRDYSPATANWPMDFQLSKSKIDSEFPKENEKLNSQPVNNFSANLPNKSNLIERAFSKLPLKERFLAQINSLVKDKEKS